MSEIKAIEKSSIHKITSGQVIIDLQTAVKELVENSLDAGASNIEVRFKNYGVRSIEVVDNGSGIAEEAYESIALKHHTSKLSSFAELSTVRSFGFRGEAMSSLCTLCESVTVTTTVSPPMGDVLEMDRNGKVGKRSKVARQRGTTVLLTNIFSNLPVRRKEFERNSKREFSKALALLNAYVLVPCTSSGVRLTVTNQIEKGQKTTQIRSQSSHLKDSVRSLWGPKALENIVELFLEFSVEQDTRGAKRLSLPVSIDTVSVKVIGLISKFSVSCGRTGTDRQFFYINGRPCNMPKIQKAFNEIYRSFNAIQAPFIVADFIIPTESCDINVSPDKRTVFLHNEQNLITELKSHLEKTFSPSRSTYDINISESNSSPVKDSVHTPINSQESSSSKGSNRAEQQYYIPDANEYLNDPPSYGLKNIPPTPVISSSPPIALFVPSSSPTPDQDSNIGLPVEVDELRCSSSPGQPESLSPSNIEADFTLNTSQTSWSHVMTPKKLNSNSNQENNEVVAAEEKSRRPQKRRMSEGNLDDADADTTDREESKFPRPKKRRTSGDVDASIVDEEEKLSRLDNRQTSVNVSVDVDTETGDQEETIIFCEKSCSSRSRPRSTAVLSSPKRFRSAPDIRDHFARFARNGSRTISVLSDNLDAEEDDMSESGEDDTNLPAVSIDVDSGNGSETRSTRPASISDISTDHDLEPSLVVSVTHVNLPFDSNLSLQTFSKRTESSDLGLEPDVSVSAVPSSNTEFVARPEVIRSVDGDEVLLRFNLNKISEKWLHLHQQLRTVCNVKGGRNLTHLPTAAGISNTENNGTAEDALSRVIDKDDFQEMDIIGQFNLGFIVTRRRKMMNGGSSADDLFIVDQHASDEKYNFETLQGTTIIKSQKLFRPEILELTAADEFLALENIEILRKNGFEVQVDTGEVDRSRLKITAKPVSKDTTFETKDLEELISFMQDKPAGHMVRCSKARAMFAMRACRKSVMVGMPLSRNQMLTVVHHMGTIDSPWNCPHGRPTMRHLFNMNKDQRVYNRHSIDWEAFK